MANVITFAQNTEAQYPTVEAYVNGEYAGYFSVASEGAGSYRVENVEIESNFRDMGLYKKLMVAAFDAFNISDIRSEKRNDKSNPIYCYWLGQDVEKEDAVWITRNTNGEIEFSL